MADIILPFNKKKQMGQNQNMLQAQMFAELEAKGLLRVKAIAGTCSIYMDNVILARVIYLNPQDAVDMCLEMNTWFSNHAMNNWKAIAEEIQVF